MLPIVADVTNVPNGGKESYVPRNVESALGKIFMLFEFGEYVDNVSKRFG